MRQVEQALIVGVTVNGVHQAANYTEIVMQHLSHRRDAVGRA